MAVFTLLISLMGHSQSLKPGISIKTLQQGSWIQQQEGLYYQTAEWIVLMSVSTPPPTKKLFDFATKLRRQIQQVSTRFPQLSENWLGRLDWCRTILQQLNPVRPNRAPLGFIRRLSHTLFGTVTEAELAQYRNLVLANRLSLNQTIHRTNLLMSAVKANRNIISSNSDHILKVQKYLLTLQSSLSRNFKTMSDTVQQLSVKVKLEHALLSLEQSTHRLGLLSHLDHRRRQMNSLYRHSWDRRFVVTHPVEGNIGQSQVLQVHHNARKYWYYQFYRVFPLWISIAEVTFKVHLLLHDGKNYILYSLHSFPLPIKPGFTTKLQVNPKVAYSLTNGLVFEPILCRGGTSKVCRGGPLYTSKRFKCERALIFRNAGATGHCQVKVTPSNDTSSILGHKIVHIEKLGSKK